MPPKLVKNRTPVARIANVGLYPLLRQAKDGPINYAHEAAVLTDSRLHSALCIDRNWRWGKLITWYPTMIYQCRKLRLRKIFAATESEGLNQSEEPIAMKVCV